MYFDQFVVVHSKFYQQFQLYHGDKFLSVEESGISRKNNQLTDRNETTVQVICTDYNDSNKQSLLQCNPCILHETSSSLYRIHNVLFGLTHIK